MDDRPVVADAPDLSRSAPRRPSRPISAITRNCSERLAQLADVTTARLRDRQLKAGQVFIKVRRRDFVTFTRQRSFTPPTQETRLVAEVARTCWNAGSRSSRASPCACSASVSASLPPARQLDLFASLESAESQKLDETLDRIHGVGTEAIRRGSDP